MLGKCRSCGAPILWIKTVPNKRMMPCDPQLFTLVTKEGLTVKGYRPHWASCPEGEKLRRR